MLNTIKYMLTDLKVAYMLNNLKVDFLIQILACIFESLQFLKKTVIY